MHVIDSINNIFWGYFLIAALLGCALWFTIRTKGVQFRMVKEMLHLVVESNGGKEEGRHISSFQAFMVSLAGRVGTGNLAGVAGAIAIGGPGAVFWMWMTALLGAATSFIECTLAQLFKVRGNDSFMGGPAYYIEKGLGKKWLGVLVSVLLIISFGLSNNSVQSNTICAAMQEAFGVKPYVMGIILSVLTAAIIFGGIQRIAKASSMIVPFMALIYIVVALVVVACNIKMLPSAIGLIFKSAFGWKQAAGGFCGAAIMQGIKRGLFSNEAGEGSSPNVASTANVSHPVKQGLVQSLGVFTDTLVICSCTAFIILCSGVDIYGGLDGVNLTQAAISATLGPAGKVLVAVVLFFFVFSTILGNYYYGEANVRYITSSRTALNVFRICTVAMVMFGSLCALSTAWALIDICMALLTTFNLVTLMFLYKWAVRLLEDYCRQKKEGRDPVFHKSQLKEISDRIGCWD
ncbi:MAG: alanine:cation symporter family protein [Bacteroidales bacterium]|nr:alanine:cation symporter family protein [Candidatus Equibacterium intestinale]